MFTFLIFILSILQVCRFYEAIPYNSLLNPIFIYSPIYITLFVMMRIGAYSSFSPRYYWFRFSFTNDPSKAIGRNYINFVGYFPEIFWIVEIFLEVLIDVIFYKCADKKIEAFVLSQVSDEIKS